MVEKTYYNLFANLQSQTDNREKVMLSIIAIYLSE